MSVITHERSLENFKEQFEYAIGHYTSHNKKISNYNNIIIGGLGGSGIGGRIARSYFINEMPVPVEVFSDYHVPAYAGERTLAILCSYSGNTEETLTMFGEAQDRGCDHYCYGCWWNAYRLSEKTRITTLYNCLRVPATYDFGLCIV